MLEQGRIVEQGSHQELLEKNGKYAQMWRVRAGRLVRYEVEEITREAFSYPGRIGRGGIGCPYEHWMVHALRERFKCPLTHGRWGFTCCIDFHYTGLRCIIETGLTGHNDFRNEKKEVEIL